MQKDTKRKIDPLAEISLRPLPFLALLAIVVPAFFLIWMHFTPAVLNVLQRDPKALAQGQWWRIFSPLLVDSDGWLQFVTVSIGFLCIGIPAQHWLGWGRWLLLFFAGATAGEIMGYLWQPYGGGTSVALFGLIGGMVIFMLRRKQPILFLTSIFALYEVVAIVGSDMGSIWLSVGLCVVYAVLIRVCLTKEGGLRVLVWLVNGTCLLVAGILLLLHDIHGAALLAGMGVGAVLAWLDPTFQPTTSRV
ncbi:MAG: rhomboid family intramembrane serine protease [Chloroflexota bacterium]|nr:rhomboid family intramembrane serine protease [Chloroflexota bacterium]